MSVIGVVFVQLIHFSLKNSQAWGRKYPFISQLEFLGLVKPANTKETWLY